MKSELNFWRSLEKYARKVAGRSPLPWQWVGIGGVLLVVVMSWSYSSQTVVAARNITEIIEMAVAQGDYETARKLYEQCQVSQCQSATQNVLGAESDQPDDEIGLEDMVYPERIVERRIAELESRLEEYPSNREIFLNLADLYGQLDGMRADDNPPLQATFGDKANEYREKARVLDPNNIEFQ